MVSFYQEKFHLKLVKMELLKGYDQHDDTLCGSFIASELIVCLFCHHIRTK
jgi:hypothetical protein